MRLAAPRPVAGCAPLPRELAPDVWSLDRQLRFPGGMRLPSRTTILRLRDGSLVVLSAPPNLGSAGADAIDSLGEVKQIVAPNTFHYVYAEEFARRYPDARLLASPGLIERAPELPPAQELGPRPPEEWSGELDYAILGPVGGASETLFFHLPTGTLVLTDLAFNMTAFARSFDRIGWRLSGIPARFGPARSSRLLLLRDRAVARRCLSRVSEWPIRRIVVAHGEAIEHDARARFSRAFSQYIMPVSAA